MDIIKQIRETSSTLGKHNILQANKDNTLLKKILYITYSPKIRFYIKNFDIPESSNTYELEEAINDLENIYTRLITGNEAREFLNSILLKTKDQDVVVGIVSKDLRLGIGKTEINKVFKNLIEKPPYMGAVPYSESRIKELLQKSSYIYSQTKVDGMYVNATKEGVESRVGTELTLTKDFKFIEELSQLDDDIVLNGELTIDGIDRALANGIINSISKFCSLTNRKTKIKAIDKFVYKHGKISFYKENIKLTCWDILTKDEYGLATSSKPYKDRLELLKATINNFKNIEVVDTKVVENLVQVKEHFIHILSEGGEGTIVKCPNSGWKNGKPTYQVKMKLEIDLDLKITGFNYGTGKNKNWISTINCESSDGLLKTTAGGMKESSNNNIEPTMKYVTNHQEELLGTIVTVRCNGFAKEGLLHPRVEELREDKSEAQSLLECREIYDAAMNLKS